LSISNLIYPFSFCFSLFLFYLFFIFFLSKILNHGAVPGTDAAQARHAS